MAKLKTELGELELSIEEVRALLTKKVEVISTPLPSTPQIVERKQRKPALSRDKWDAIAREFLLKEQSKLSFFKSKNIDACGSNYNGLNKALKRISNKKEPENLFKEIIVEKKERKHKVQEDYSGLALIAVDFLKTGNPISASRFLREQHITPTPNKIENIKKEIKKFGYSFTDGYKTWTPERRDKMAKRMKWINDRARTLLPQFNQNWEKSITQAAKEYDGKYQKTELIPPPPAPASLFVEPKFPDIFPVTEQGKEQIIALIKHIIANKGKIGLFDVVNCSMTEKGEWNGVLWHEFVRDFMIKSKTICDYFNVPNRFIWDKQSGYDYIKYE